MREMIKSIAGTQFLAALFALVYFGLLHYQRHPNAVGIGLQLWGFFAVLFVPLYIYLSITLWVGKVKQKKAGTSAQEA